MKKFNILLFITVIILLLLSGWSIFHQPGYSSEDQFVTPTNIHFEKDTLSLGSVKYGTEQKAVFRFTNTGTAPLLIYNVVPSCDCTAVKWKKRPIKPGESGEIQTVYSPNSLGMFIKNIEVRCNAVFDIAELREVTAYDELELDTLGDRKTALFLIMSDTDDSFNFLISMCYTQLFNLLCEKADDVYGGRLPVHVRCLIDECANIGQIPKLEKLVATIRSREISACLVLQAQSQLKAIYKDNADTIIGNMDTSIFLGGKEPTTLKELAAVLGKETIDTYNTGESRGRETSHSLNYQKLGKELMSQDELAVMDGGKCILQLRGVRPFLSDKYDITKHPNFKYTADADDKNAFDIEAFLSARLKLKPNEVCDVYEVDTKGA